MIFEVVKHKSFEVIFKPHLNEEGGRPETARASFLPLRQWRAERIYQKKLKNFLRKD